MSYLNSMILFLSSHVNTFVVDVLSNSIRALLLDILQADGLLKKIDRATNIWLRHVYDKWASNKHVRWDNGLTSSRDALLFPPRSVCPL